MSRERRARRSNGKPRYAGYETASALRKITASSFYIHPLLAFPLIVFFPIKIVLVIVSAGLAFSSWMTWAAKGEFDFLSKNLRFRSRIVGSFIPHGLLLFLGAWYHCLPLNEWLFTLIGLMGLLAMVLTVWLGYSAGMEAHHKEVLKLTASIDWMAGTYDVDSNSLDSGIIDTAMIRSYPTWKVLFVCTAFLLPGPAIGVMAGKLSNFGRYLVALPAGWAISMLFIYFFLRTYVDYKAISRLENEKGVKLLLSTSPQAIS